MHSLIQVEIQTGVTHTLTWLEATMKPRTGMNMTHKGDPRLWTIVAVYPLVPRTMESFDRVWKIGEAACALA